MGNDNHPLCWMRGPRWHAIGFGREGRKRRRRPLRRPASPNARATSATQARAAGAASPTSDARFFERDIDWNDGMSAAFIVPCRLRRRTSLSCSWRAWALASAITPRRLRKNIHSVCSGTPSGSQRQRPEKCGLSAAAIAEQIDCGATDPGRARL